MLRSTPSCLLLAAFAYLDCLDLEPCIRLFDGAVIDANLKMLPHCISQHLKFHKDPLQNSHCSTTNVYKGLLHIRTTWRASLKLTGQKSHILTLLWRTVYLIGHRRVFQQQLPSPNLMTMCPRGLGQMLPQSEQTAESTLIWKPGRGQCNPSRSLSQRAMAPARAC